MKAQELHLGEVGSVRVPWAPTCRLGAGGLTGWLHCCRSGRGRQKNAWVVPWGDGEGHPPPRSIHGDDNPGICQRAAPAGVSKQRLCGHPRGSCSATGVSACVAPQHHEGSEGVIILLLPPSHHDTDSRLYCPGGQEKPQQLSAPAMTVITAKSVIWAIAESPSGLLQPLLGSAEGGHLRLSLLWV